MADTGDEERFWRSVEKAPGDGCWEWQGRLYRDGYGEFSFMDDGKARRAVAHRWLWQHLNGPAPRTMHVCHRCDNRRRVRPDHLFLGTPTDNERDKMAKGRRPATVGDDNPNARLTESDVVRMRQLRVEGWSFVRLAAEYGLSYAHAKKVAHGVAWANVPMPAGGVRKGRLSRTTCPKCGGPCDPRGRCKPCNAAAQRARVATARVAQP